MTRLGVRVDGPAGAPPLILANSLGTSADMWQPQMGVLTQRFRVVRYEHRGHGGTVAPPGPYAMDDLGSDLVSVLDDIGIERASVMGLSLGGSVALWTAIHHPERVDRLVVACSAAHWPPAEAWRQRIDAVRQSGLASLLPVLLQRWFTDGFVDRRSPAGQLVASMLERVDAEGYCSCCAALEAMDLRNGLDAITAPTLILAGAADPVVSLTTGAELAGAIAGAGYTVIPGGAHLVNIEQADRFNAAVVDHLAAPPLERGRLTRREVLGDAHVDRSEARTTALTAPFSEMLTRYAWGEIWTRPGLDRRTRSCITVAMLVAVGRFDELELHLRGARRNGLSVEEISEVLLQTAIYCGVPAANSAFAVAARVFAEEDA